MTIEALSAQLSPSRLNTWQDKVPEIQKISDRERLVQKIAHVLIDIRMLAKALTKSGRRAPLVQGDARPAALI